MAQLRYQKPADGSDMLAIAQIRWQRTLGTAKRAALRVASLLITARGWPFTVRTTFSFSVCPVHASVSCPSAACSWSGSHLFGLVIPHP